MQVTGQQRQEPIATPERKVGSTPSFSRRIVMLLLVMMTWLYSFSYQPILHNPNEMVRLYATAALVETASYQIDPMRKRWGWVNDAALFKGHFFSVKGPLTTWLAAPGYVIALGIAKLQGQPHPKLSHALWWSRLSSTIVPTLLFLWWLLPLLGEVISVPLGRDALWLTLALGSNGFAYSVMMVSHMIAGVCAYIAWQRISSKPDHPKAWLYTGIWIAATTAAEYTGVVISVVLMVAALMQARGTKSRGWLIAGAMIPTTLVMHMQWACFGNPLSPGHLHMENPSFRQFHERGVFGADHFYPEAASQLLLSPTFGLFVLSPILLFGLLGIWRCLRSAQPWTSGGKLAVLTVGLMWFECAWLSNWRGGWTVGPRYLTPILPLMVWLSATGLQWAFERQRLVASAWAWAGLVIGLVLAGLPSAIYPHVPETMTRPIPELIWPAFEFGFAPQTLGSMLGLQGRWAWAPLCGLLTAAALVPLWPSKPAAVSSLKTQRVIALGSWFIGLMLLSAMMTPSFMNPAVRTSATLSRGFILGNWHPAGHDDFARHRSQRTSSPQQLVTLLLRQGRARQATSLLPKLPQAEAKEIKKRYKALFEASHVQSQQRQPRR